MRYFDKEGVELNFGDILESDEFPFDEDKTPLYYGIILWNTDDKHMEVRCTSGYMNIDDDLNDGIVSYIENESNDRGVLVHYTKVGNVRNVKDVYNYLKDKSWSIEDCNIK